MVNILISILNAQDKSLLLWLAGMLALSIFYTSSDCSAVQKGYD